MQLTYRPFTGLDKDVVWAVPGEDRQLEEPRNSRKRRH